MKVFAQLMVLAALLASGCVSTRKYTAAQARITGLQNDSAGLARQIASQQAELRTLEGKLGQMQASNQFTSSQLNQSQEEIQRQRERLEQMQALLDRQRSAVEGLRKKMADALVGFTSDQLTVAIKNGKVYVSLQESLLFPSGSAEVNPKGKEALGSLAAVLNQNMDINVLVEGHTDSIPISKSYADNWALSVARSTAIARILLKDYNVAPERITASGRGEFQPVDSNSTPEGRARNRRTEIILEPKLDELMRLLNEPVGAPGER